ncbi:MAG: 3-isopropylmalate dehydrogenase [Myxococcales bacterium]|nr:3-isopropylmalate dehydrogenase [Myxococcales bacterium]
MTKKVAVIGGDGIGPEVVAEGVKVLEALKELRGWAIELHPFELGAERYLKDGTTFPAEVSDFIAKECDAVLLGALGDPRVPDMKHARDILFGLRFGLDLFVNLRPIQCLHERLMPLKGVRPDEVDIIVLRENTEGIYVGMGGTFKQGTPDEVATQVDLNTRKGVERIIREAFEIARRTGRKSVHMADKHNAMPDAHGLWLRTFREVATEYPEIAAHHVFVDALCLYLVQDPRPFEVIVSCNLFGDIITDLGAALQGGLGMAASGNVHPGRVSMFEPVHGSAPPLAGKDVANPLATVLTVGMLLTHLGFEGEEALLTRLVREAIETGHCTREVGGDLGTRATGDWIVRRLREEAK